MNKFLIILAFGGLFITIMAVPSNYLQSFAPGAILFFSALFNLVKTKKSAIITYGMTIFVCVFLLNIVRENIVHNGHMTDTGIMFLFSAVLTFLFGALPIWLKNHEYEMSN